MLWVSELLNKLFTATMILYFRCTSKDSVDIFQWTARTSTFQHGNYLFSQGFYILNKFSIPNTWQNRNVRCPTELLVKRSITSLKGTVEILSATLPRMKRESLLKSMQSEHSEQNATAFSVLIKATLYALFQTTSNNSANYRVEFLLNIYVISKCSHVVP